MILKAKIVLFLMFINLGVSAQIKSNDRVTAHFEDIPLSAILDSLTSQVDYFFSYNSTILEGTGKFSISCDNEPIDQFLSRLLVGTGIEYSFFKDQIILNYMKVEAVPRKKKNMFRISGKVVDENGKTLVNTNVFLEGTTIGTTSDIDGNYFLESVPPGYYDLVFSHVGYKNSVYSISEINGGSRIQDHQMILSHELLDEVEVISKRVKKGQSQWELNFIVFKKELLGNSENSEKCIIENPEAIDFFYDKKNEILRAYANGPLQIRNDALGYRISYYLESFERTPSNLRYRGQIRFRNDTPMNGVEKRAWNRNRKISYNGSFNHFKNALLSGELKKEGFKAYELKKLDDFGKENNLLRFNADDLISLNKDHFSFSFKNYLMIEYHKEKESLDFLTDFKYSSLLYDDLITDNGIINKIPGDQISIIKLLKKSIRLDRNGQIEDKFALTTYGYWSWERLADLVPINYDPKLDKL